jgi:hypothetical protein
VKSLSRRRIAIVLIALIACAWLSWSRDHQPCATCIPTPGGFCEYQPGR